ncbi:MAG: cytochrome c, partial [Draconibacterium sp.]|nr:cytochrome c [Draconibacterium sp.]
EDLAAAEKVFTTTCAVCHGADGKGIATFPNLTDDEWLTGNSPSEVFNSISNGNISKGMIPYKDQLSEKQITQLTSYILITLQK